MKAIEINGKIKTYNRLPKTWDSNGTTINNFNKLSDKEAQDFGFFDVVMPTYDSVTQQISNLHFDKDKFVYDVTDKVFSQTLDEAKDTKKSEVKKKAGDLLKVTDWYVIRNADISAGIPENIATERADIRDKADASELEIDALETIAEVLKYQIVLVEPIDPLV
jgi:hypothetical protein